MKTRAGGWFALHVMNPVDKRVMKWTNGKLNTAVGTDVRENGVLLRCTGAKSGKVRDVPHNNPAWYHNLKAHPQCSMIVPNRGEVACVAHEADGAERERAWQAPNALYSGYTVYQGRTDRRIPVMVLVPQT